MGQWEENRLTVDEQLIESTTTLNIGSLVVVIFDF